MFSFQNQSYGADEAFKILARAFEFLGTPDQRQKYNLDHLRKDPIVVRHSILGIYGSIRTLFSAKGNGGTMGTVTTKDERSKSQVLIINFLLFLLPHRNR